MNVLAKKIALSRLLGFGWRPEASTQPLWFGLVFKVGVRVGLKLRGKALA